MVKSQRLNTLSFFNIRVFIVCNRCTWKGVECNMTEMFTPVWTEVGLCYTFNANQRNFTFSETGIF